VSSTVTRNSDTPSKPRSLRAPATGLLGGDRRPATGRQAPRTRSWGLVVLAALLVIGTGLAVAAWGLQVGDKESVLAVRHPIAKGQVIDRGDMVSTSVAGFDAAIPMAELASVVGKTASVDLVQGQVLTSAMFTSSPVPAAGESVIGLALDPTRVPGAGLDPGDVVDVVAVPGGDDAQADPTALDTPEVLAAAAEVYDVGGSATAGGQVLVTLVVDAKDAARIAAYSTQNRVAVVETAPTDSDMTGADTTSGE
jgi:hypothetical protein